MFKETPLSTLIDVPLSHIPESVYKSSLDLINKLPFETLPGVVMWTSGRILTELQGDAQHTCSESKVVARFVVLAMVLRSKPHALTAVLRNMRERPSHQGEDKLPVIIWMMAQASKSDLSAGLYSWAYNLLPLVGRCSTKSMDDILRFVEMILSNPEAKTILVNGAVNEEERLIPPCSFEILLRMTFPPSFERERRKQRAGEGNPVLAKEATSVAIWSLTENIDCFKQWDVLYKDNLEASLALLKKLVKEWKDDDLLKLPSDDTLTLNRAMNSFRLKNEKGITEGGANCCLYKEADKSCKLISGRISRGRDVPNRTPIITALDLALTVVAGCLVGAALALSWIQRIDRIVQ